MLLLLLAVAVVVVINDAKCGCVHATQMHIQSVQQQTQNKQQNKGNKKNKIDKRFFAADSGCLFRLPLCFLPLSINAESEREALWIYFYNTHKHTQILFTVCPLFANGRRAEMSRNDAPSHWERERERVCCSCCQSRPASQLSPWQASQHLTFVCRKFPLALAVCPLPPLSCLSSSSSPQAQFSLWREDICQCLSVSQPVGLSWAQIDSVLLVNYSP